MSAQRGTIGIGVLIEQFEGDKDAFLAEMRSRICAHVASRSPGHCLELVTRRDGATATWSILDWSVEDKVPYALRLIAYLRKKPYVEDGRIYEVDSVLTGEILDLVMTGMSELIQQRKELIADVALAEIMLNDATREQFLGVLLHGRAAKVLNAKGKAVVAAALLGGLQQKLGHVSSSIAASLGEKVTHVLAVASKSALATGAGGIATKYLATASGQILLSKLSLMMAKSLAPLVTKLLATPVIAASLKKIVVAAFIASLAKLLAAKIGMSVTAAVWTILVPVIVWFLVKDVRDLPKKLAPALADAVCGDLRATYTISVTAILTDVIAGFATGQTITEIAAALGDDPEFTAELAKLIGTVASGAV